MDIDSTKLTVFFEAPFWIGVFERIERRKLSVCKVVFGAEPKDYEVWEYLLKNYSRLRFSPSVETVVKNEIYFKRQPLTEEQKKHGSYVDENGNLHVKNLSAFWIPELTTTEKVGHTTYTVTGSYEGKESFLKKLERIVAKNAQQKFEDEGADE